MWLCAKKKVVRMGWKCYDLWVIELVWITKVQIKIV